MPTGLFFFLSFERFQIRPNDALNAAYTSVGPKKIGFAPVLAPKLPEGLQGNVESNAVPEFKAVSDGLGWIEYPNRDSLYSALFHSIDE
jgi:hypothetical protein